MEKLNKHFRALIFFSIIAFSFALNGCDVKETATEETTDTTIENIAKTSDKSDLTDLIVSDGTNTIEISPVFDPKVLSYTADLGNNLFPIKIIAIGKYTVQTIYINHIRVASGAESGFITINDGSNTIEIRISSPGGINIYTLTVLARATDNAKLSSLGISSGTLSPVFDKAVITYTASVGSTVDTIAVTPTADDIICKSIVIDNNNDTDAAITATSGSPSTIKLGSGYNNITILVTAANGTTQLTYTVTVWRNNYNANLSGLSISSGTLSPAFDKDTISYTASVGSAVALIAITPTAEDPYYTSIIINEVANVTSGNSKYIGLANGANIITIVVTAPDGTTTKTYTLTITRS